MSELAVTAARELLDQRFEARVTPSGRRVDEFWCSSMGGNGTRGRKASSAAIEPVCGQLRVFFDVGDEKMPESLARLADRLDAALARGDLGDGKSKGPSR